MIVGFIVLLSSLARVADLQKFVFSNDEPSSVRPTLINMNPVDFKYYLFKISLNKCTGSCNVLSPKMCVPKGTKDINVKGFNMIINKDEAKAMEEHVLCDFKYNSIAQHVIYNKNGITKYINVNAKIFIRVKRIIIGILAHVFVKIVSTYFVMDFISTKKTNTIATNVTNTASINCNNKKVIDGHILHTVLLVINLLLIVTIICYNYAKQKSIK